VKDPRVCKQQKMVGTDKVRAIKLHEVRALRISRVGKREVDFEFHCTVGRLARFGRARTEEPVGWAAKKFEHCTCGGSCVNWGKWTRL